MFYLKTSLSEKTLLAGYQLHCASDQPFSCELLIMKVWKLFPDACGLKSYEHLHPDSNKIISVLSGCKGLIAKGLLVKHGQKLYGLTLLGRQTAKGLIEANSRAEPGIETERKLTVAEQVFLDSTLGGEAVSKYQQGFASDITFTDACRFWDLCQTKGAIPIDQVEQFERLLGDLDSLFLQKSGFILPTGQSIGGGDIAMIISTHNYLKARYGRLHLQVLSKRKEIG